MSATKVVHEDYCGYPDDCNCIKRRAVTEGVAVLFSGDPETGETSMDVFREPDSDTDPYHRAAALRDSCGGDFPTRYWSIALNDRARELMKDERMRRMGLS